MITYLLQVSACAISFYAIYHLLLRRNKFFNLQRIYLVLSLVASFVIPFIGFGAYQPAAVQQLPAVPGALAFEDFEIIESGAGEVSFTLTDYLTIGYTLIAVFLLIRLCIMVINLIRTIKTGTKKPLGRYTLLYTDQPVFIASFFRYIFVQKPLNVEEESFQYMLLHEEKHLKELHFLDLILLECTKIILWFNPITYCYSKSLKTVHEYICDDEVIKHTSPEHYERLLIQTWFKRAGLPLVSQFHEISIKNRINMMKKQNNKWYSKFKFLATIPVALLLIIACNQENLPTISQERTVEGKVMNSEGNIIPGATIVVEGTNLSTITDMEGQYKITIPPGDVENLIYSFNGLNPVSVEIGKRSIIDVSLSKGSNTKGSYADLPSFHEDQFTFDNKKIVKGKIVTADGAPMPGVNVVIVGTKRGAITNIKGEYGIQVPDEGGNLAFSFVGFNTEYINIDDKSVIDVQMSSSGQLGTGEAFLPSGKKELLKVQSTELDRNGKRFLAGTVTSESNKVVAKATIFVLRDNKVISLGETDSNGSFEIALEESDAKVFFKHKAYRIG
ncbi:MAG: carboxypeptidase-like regulatory domain-containing protein, partial [Bacteroidota bacterium]